MNTLFELNLDTKILFRERNHNLNINMTDYANLYNLLINNYGLTETSKKMKEQVGLSSEEFRSYFQDERKNYRTINEVLELC